MSILRLGVDIFGQGKVAWAHGWRGRDHAATQQKRDVFHTLPAPEIYTTESSTQLPSGIKHLQLSWATAEREMSMNSPLSPSAEFRCCGCFRARWVAKSEDVDLSLARSNTPASIYLSRASERVPIQAYSFSLCMCVRGLPYMTSEQKGGGGFKKYPKFADKQYIKFGQRGEGVFKNPNILWTSYMEAP